MAINADNQLEIDGVKWIHIVSPSNAEIEQIWEDYNLHEIVIEDLMELNTQDKIDVYDDHISIALHFPKMDVNRTKYMLNEFNIVLGKDYLITVTRFPTNNITRLINQFKHEAQEYKEDQEHYKITPYYMLYLVIDAMYDKMNKLLYNVSKDLLSMEDRVFAKTLDNAIISNLLFKKRNISFIKHNFSTQKEVLEELVEVLPSFYEDKLEVYFDDLISRRTKIQSTVSDIQENVDSLAETYNSLMNIRINDALLTLTMFTIIIWVLTLIAGIYGMNVRIPLESHPQYFWFILIGLTVLSIIIYILMKYIFLSKWWKRIR